MYTIIPQNIIITSISCYIYKTTVTPTGKFYTYVAEFVVTIIVSLQNITNNILFKI